MRNLLLIVIFTTTMVSCKNEMESSKMKFLVKKVPQNTPIEFKQNLVPPNKIIHKGIFSPNLETYYYTISDQNFQQFDVFTIKKEDGIWTEPEHAFFNSNFSEHGMSFSADGNTLYFSSTRPVNISGVHPTWHIWKSDKIDGKWSTPIFIDIPNLRDKLVSHPTISNSGTLYFHSSNPDYSEMDIYQSKRINGAFQDAKKAQILVDSKAGKCTPFVSPEGDYLIFAIIGSQLDLMISFNDGNGQWSDTRKFNSKINDAGQGNPYITPDNTFLFYTTGNDPERHWSVKWVNIRSELENN